MSDESWPHGPGKERIWTWEQKPDRKPQEHPIAIHLRENMRERVAIQRKGIEPSDLEAHFRGEEAPQNPPSEGSPTEILHIPLHEAIIFAMSGLSRYKGEKVPRDEDYATISEIEYILSGHKDLPFQSQQEAWVNFKSNNVNRASREAIKRAIKKAPEIVRLGSTRNSVYVYDPLQTGDLERRRVAITMLLCTKGASPEKLNNIAKSILGYDGEELFIDESMEELPSKYMGNEDWRGRLLQKTGDWRENDGLFSDIHVLLHTLQSLTVRENSPIQFKGKEIHAINPAIWSTREDERSSKNLTISNSLAGVSSDFSIVFDSLRKELTELVESRESREEGDPSGPLDEWWEESFGEIPPPSKHQGRISDSLVTEIALWHLFHSINEASHAYRIDELRTREKKHKEDQKKKRDEHFRPLEDSERYEFFNKQLDRFRDLPDSSPTKPEDFESFDIEKLVEASDGLHEEAMIQCIDAGLMEACGDWENPRPLEMRDWENQLRSRERSIHSHSM